MTAGGFRDQRVLLCQLLTSFNGMNWRARRKPKGGHPKHGNNAITLLIPLPAHRWHKTLFHAEMAVPLRWCASAWALEWCGANVSMMEAWQDQRQPLFVSMSVSVAFAVGRGPAEGRHFKEWLDGRRASGNGCINLLLVDPVLFLTRDRHVTHCYEGRSAQIFIGPVLQRGHEFGVVRGLGVATASRERRRRQVPFRCDRAWLSPLPASYPVSCRSRAP